MLRLKDYKMAGFMILMSPMAFGEEFDFKTRSGKVTQEEFLKKMRDFMESEREEMLDTIKSFPIDLMLVFRSNKYSPSPLCFFHPLDQSYSKHKS